MTTNYRRNVPKGEIAMPPASPYTRHTPKPEMAMPIHRGAVIAKGTIEGFGSWSLDEQGLLYIQGAGEMPDWKYDWQEKSGNRPWEDVIEKIQSLRIADGVTGIRENALRGCSSLREVHLPDSVTSIGRLAFCSCSSLTEIRLPDGLTSIGFAAFYNCSSLREVHLPDSLTSIGKWAFEKCSSLREIHIPKAVTELGIDVLRHCTGLRKVTMPTRFDRLLFKWNYGISKDIVTFI